MLGMVLCPEMGELSSRSCLAPTSPAELENFAFLFFLHANSHWFPVHLRAHAQATVGWVMVWQCGPGSLWHSPTLGKGLGCLSLCWPCPAARPWSVLPKQELHRCSLSLHRLLLLRCRTAFLKAWPSLQPRDSHEGGALGHQCSGSSRAAPSSLV